jgi:hypothetical protein
MVAPDSAARSLRQPTKRRPTEYGPKVGYAEAGLHPSSWLKGIVARSPSDKMCPRRAAMLSITAATPASSNPPNVTLVPYLVARGSCVVGFGRALNAVLQQLPEAVIATQYHEKSAEPTGPAGVREDLLGVDAGVAT